METFQVLCKEAPLPLCALIGDGGVKTDCYARNVELANTLIFQTGKGDRALLLRRALTLQYTAVGRKEILNFFYMYMILTVLSLCLDCGVIPMSSVVVPYFVAAQLGWVVGMCWCLMLNGFVGFQFHEDGTAMSVWLLRITSFTVFLGAGAMALCSFNSWLGMSPHNSIPLLVVQYVLPAAFLIIYVIAQIILVLRTLTDRWPLGDIAFGTFFLVSGQAVLYLFSRKICVSMNHYLDGLFVATICNLFAVMMVYKYWDSITKEDLEFSIVSKSNAWLLQEKDQRYI